MKNDLNKGIFCNVKGCVFNEHGQGCNLDKVTISKGTGEHHFCKSYIALDNEKEEEFPLENEERFHANIESAQEYFDYGDLMEDIESDIEDIDEVDDLED